MMCVDPIKRQCWGCLYTVPRSGQRTFSVHLQSVIVESEPNCLTTSSFSSLISNQSITNTIVLQSMKPIVCFMYSVPLRIPCIPDSVVQISPELQRNADFHAELGGGEGGEERTFLPVAQRASLLSPSTLLREGFGENVFVLLLVHCANSYSRRWQRGSAYETEPASQLFFKP